ncbi:Tetratricopeptide repeat-containing protein [Seinonella peptonophila]|uniref:Tetratricopeptide repeat-containing protein n=1 Tax=Seinonella peptonophila TaxID=112248 RepID=A0A1M4SV50_9BACL|nr:tetratricopeptide repeat protein [Seinonella peptonophila]SHE36070.1 Tetratricopeptide repeat-containing protein [Seinonella peptonophila]
MLHTQWFEQMKKTLEEMEEKYPQSTDGEREKYKLQLQQIRKNCDQLLKAWATVEAQVGKLSKKHPELFGEVEEEAIGESFYLEESAVRHFRQGQGYYQLMMFKEANQMFEQVINEEPDFILGRLYLGLSQFQQGELEQAEQHFRWVSHISTEDIFIGFSFHMLGCIQVRKENDLQAVRFFQKAVSFLPDLPDAWFNIGACYYRLQEYQEAISAFHQTLKYDKDDWESMYYLSNCYRYYHDWGNVSFWRLASLEKQKHPQIIESIAQDCEEMGDHECAINWYLRLMVEDRNSWTAYHGMVWNFWVMGKKDAAWLWLKKGLTLFPQQIELLYLQIWMLLDEGRLTELKQIIQILPLNYHERPITWMIFSRFYSLQGNTDEAFRITEEMVQQSNQTIQAFGYYQKGRILLDKQQPQQAIRFFQKAFELESSWTEPKFFEGICHMLAGELDRTEQCWRVIAFPYMEN